MERIKGRENVVGGDPEDTVGEEGKTPCDTQHAAQSQNGNDAFATSAILRIAYGGSLPTEEPGQYDDEGSEGEDEDQRIVAYVDNVVGVTVGYPAPWNRKKHLSKGKEI